MCRLISSDDSVDIVNFFGLYIFVCILFYQMNYNLPPTLLYFVDDLHLLINYNWAMAVHYFLFEEISTIGDWIKKMKVGDSTKIIEYVRGCVALLMLNKLSFWHIYGLIYRIILNPMFANIFTCLTIREYTSNFTNPLSDSLMTLEIELCKC